MAIRSARSILCLSALGFITLLSGCGSIAHTIACDTGINNNSNCTCGPCPISPGPEFLYATSLSNNQVLTLSIDHSSGALGAAVSTPASANAAGIAAAQSQFLYLANTGAGDIDAFSIDQATGALTTVTGSPFFATGQTSFNPEALVAGTELYATSINGITGFTINSDGSLNTVAGSPFSSEVIGGAVLGQSNTNPVNYFLYASDFADPNGSISAFSVDPVTGILTSVSGAFTTGLFSAPAGMVFAGSFSTSYVYVALEIADQIAAFSVDPSTGALTPVAGSPFPAGVAPTTLALNTSQNVLYALSFVGGNVSAFNIASDGTLTAVAGSPFTVGSQPGSMVITQDNFMYVSLPAANAIAGFNTATADGSLAQLAGSPFPAASAAGLVVVQLP